MLASEVIRALGIEVQALFFDTPFFTSTQAKESAESINLPIKIIDITPRHLAVLKKPKYGYGENMNPCIDCHCLMFRIAGEMMDSEGADFIITGEVLGQRPMSQNKKALSIIDSESGIEGLILRPLSAKKLPLSLPEQYGWVDRDKMSDFSGRSRKPQIALAKKMNIMKYPSPAGGCLLTDIIFSRRLRDLFSSPYPFEIREIELLKLGRHFRITPRTKIVIGRNQAENHAIFKMARDSDLCLNTIIVPGPTSIVIGEITPEVEELAAIMTASYSNAGIHETEIHLRCNGRDSKRNVKGRDKRDFAKYMV